MIDPSLPLQKAMFDRLKADADVTAASGGAANVYDGVPQKPAWPYVRLGEVEVGDDGNTCGEAAEVFATVHVWSNKPGQVEAKRLAAAVAQALDAPLAVAGFVVEIHQIDRVRHLPGVDGVSHSIVVARYEIAPAA